MVEEGGQCEVRRQRVTTETVPIPFPILSPSWPMALLCFASRPAPTKAREHPALAVALHVGECSGLVTPSPLASTTAYVKQ